MLSACGSKSSPLNLSAHTPPPVPFDPGPSPIAPVLNIPSAPSGLAIAATTSTSINLSWGYSGSSLTGFHLEYSTNSVGSFSVVTLNNSQRSVTLSGFIPSTLYYFRIRAFNSDGESSYSSLVSATTSAAIPNGPSGLTATPASISSVNLSWVDNSSNETGFEIERGDSLLGPFFYYSAAANATAAVITGLNSGTTYFFRVRAKNGTVNSDFTASASATTNVDVPSAPSSLVASSASATAISLSWTDNSNNETGFDFERSNSSNGPFSLFTTGAAGSIAYTMPGLSPSTTYYFRVRAVNANGASSYSNVASATTSATPLQPLVSFTAASGAATGDINLTLQYPSDTSGYTQGVQIRYSVGAQAPAADCQSGQLGPQIPLPFSGTISYVHHTGDQNGAQFSYRACVLGNGTDFLGGATATAVATTGGASPTPTPSISLTANSQNTVLVAVPNESITIAWSSINAGTCALSQSGVAAAISTNTSGSISQSYSSQDVTYTLACQPPVGPALSKSVRVAGGLPYSTAHFTFSTCLATGNRDINSANRSSLYPTMSFNCSGASDNNSVLSITNLAPDGNMSFTFDNNKGTAAQAAASKPCPGTAVLSNTEAHTYSGTMDCSINGGSANIAVKFN